MMETLSGEAAPSRLTLRSVVAGLLFAAIWSLALLRPVSDADLFTQLRLGELLAERQTILLREELSYLRAGDIVWNPGWLAQLVYWCLSASGGWLLVKLCFGFFFALSFALRMQAADRGEPGPPRLVAEFLGTSLAVLAALSNSSVRPQQIGLLCFAILLLLLRQRPFGGRHVASGAVLGIIWQNAHGSLSLGALAVLAEIAGSLWRERKAAFRRVGALLLLLLLLAAAHLCTPLGIDVLAMSARNVAVSRDLLQITEWLPPYHPEVRQAMAGFWVAIFCSLPLVSLGRRLPRSELFLCLAFTAAALYASRFVLFWAVVMLPFWIRGFDALLPARRYPWRGMQACTRLQAGAGAVLMLLLVGTAAAAAPPLSHGYPFRAALELRQIVPEGRVYNYREWGGVLSFVGGPDWQVHMDGRLYLYSDAQWEEYYEAARGRLDPEALAEAHRVAAFFLHDGFHRQLIARLQGAPNWRLLTHEPPCSVFVRRRDGAPLEQGG